MPSSLSMGYSIGICLLSKSGLVAVFLVRCSILDLLTLNFELCTLLHWSPPSSFVIIYFRRFVVSVNDLDNTIWAAIGNGTIEATCKKERLTMVSGNLYLKERMMLKDI